MGKPEMTSSGLRAAALKACHSHHYPWLLQAVLETTELQQTPSSAQASKPAGGGDEGGKTSLCGSSQSVRDTSLNRVRLCLLALGCGGDRCSFHVTTHSHEDTRTFPPQKQGGINSFK